MTIRPNPNAKLWLFDFDNTLAALEGEVDWLGSRRELETFLRGEGVAEEVFAEIPKGNLPLYAALHSRWLRAPLATPPAASAVLPLAAAPRGTPARFATPARNVAEALLRHASEIIERHELSGAERALATPGAIDLLRAIAASRAVAAIIVTSNSSRTVARWLELHGAANLVHAIVGRDSALALKPSPEMVARALALASTSANNSSRAPSSSLAEKSTTKAGSATHTPNAHAATSAAGAVFVGDSEADFGAARESGLGFYGIATRASARDRLIAAGATKIFASPAALRIHLNLIRSESFSDSEPD